MSRESALAGGHRRAEASMIDTCTIRRVTGRTVDPFSGVSTPTYLNPDVYTGKCRVQQQPMRAQPHDVGEDHVELLRLDLQLPMSVTGLQINDEVTITSSVHDPDLLGRTYYIQDLFHKTEPTSRRVKMIERTGS